MTRPSRLLAALLAGALAALALTTPAGAAPTGIPSKATAQTWLTALTVATEGSTSGYSRDLFPHWITISGACNTRETVLKRDGVNVVVDSSCAATSGRWTSPYDGATWTAASDVDIDHMVPSPRPGAPAPGHGPPRGGRPTPTTSADPSCGRSPTTSTSPRATRTRPPGSHR